MHTFQLPADITGNFDHLEIDLKRKRLFVTPEDFKAVLVLDAESGKVLHKIDGIARPHALLYRPETDRLYVTDGLDGSVRVFDGENYRQVARIPLLKDADAIGFDISRKYLYVDNGGGDVGQKFSMLSVIDTASDSKLSEMKIHGDTLEAMALDNYRPRIYVNDKATNHVVVIDRFRNKQVADWPITLGKQNVAIALDEQRQRLFVGCRSGQIVVLDSNTGKELQTLSIAGGIDDLIYDPATRRIYAAANGEVDVYEQKDLDHYARLGSVPTGINAKTARLVPQTETLFVAAPKHADQAARVLAYRVANASTAMTAAPAVEQVSVKAPRAEQIALETLSDHPLLRKVGLHAIPPGGGKMLIIANGNATRVGIPTSQSDFAAVKSGGIYGPKIEDGQFYNMKMLMFDAQHRQIGILVMEIACTDAMSEEDAAKKADAIRQEIARKIPDVNSLFGPANNE
ncbi:YncE family protein [Silvibacterium acidisoli]|uniref:YncE family protein n=1 Tax=Acidobacteriaceae bacterium ZG23-2 TaxID=2883246 RepID=UPI00406C85E2